MTLQTFDPREFRSALGRFATGVTVVSYAAEGKVRGFTVNSFTSVSLDPPLILVSVGNHAQSAARMKGVPFAINVLSEQQQGHAFHFSGRPQDGLEVEWDEASDEAPTILGSLAVFRCLPWQTVEAGDHDLHIGRVTSFASDPELEPLVFLDGRFSSVRAQAA